MNSFNGTHLIFDVLVGNQWYNEFSAIPGATGNIHELAGDGLYYCTVTNADGCVSDISNVVEVEPTSNHEPGQCGIKVFPNPFKN